MLKSYAVSQSAAGSVLWQGWVAWAKPIGLAREIYNQEQLKYLTKSSS
jgi:hypothetical protein